jgi:hypothetical protein
LVRLARLPQPSTVVILPPAEWRNSELGGRAPLRMQLFEAQARPPGLVPA